MLSIGTRIKFTKEIEQDGVVFAKVGDLGTVIDTGESFDCPDTDYVVITDGSSQEFMSGYKDEFETLVTVDESEITEFKVPELSRAAKLADQVLQYAIFSGNCEDMKASEIFNLLLPIFGQTVLTELKESLKNQ
jgi:hypothetical protein